MDATGTFGANLQLFSLLKKQSKQSIGSTQRIRSTASLRYPTLGKDYKESKAVSITLNKGP